MYVGVQDGKFDRPDRQFHSVASAYHGCTTSTSDVKELTPEWFYLPDFLRNSNGLDLGERQDGITAVNDVELPPWAWSVCFSCSFMPTVRIVDGGRGCVFAVTRQSCLSV